MLHLIFCRMDSKGIVPEYMFLLLLESSLFWWSAEENEKLLQFWETYILIMETLEENQVRVLNCSLYVICYFWHL